MPKSKQIKFNSQNAGDQISKVKKSDFERISFFSKQFCLPKEIKLVEYQSDTSYRNNQQNIQIVDRVDNYDINPTFRQITSIDFRGDNCDPGDGLISLIKNLNIKVAICITVYSEDKSALKKTLQGVRKNYQTFYQKAGIHSHQIVVVIMFDGIQYLNNSKQPDKNMFNLFREFDIINGFRRKQYALAKEREQANQNQDQSMINQLENFADQMVFTEEEYELIQGLLLQNQYSLYRQMTELLQFADDIQNKKLHNTPIENLPAVVKQSFALRARMYLQQNGIEQVTDDDKQLENYVTENLPQQKIDTLKVDALKDSVIIAKDYLKSRESTAIMYQMALPLENELNGQDDAKMNLFTVVKYSNKGKLSSHLWFFQGFCNMINPSSCVLLDCGLEPDKDSIFKIWAHIETYKKTCGGVCGYMKLRPESPYDESGNRIDSQTQSLVTKLSNTFFDIQKAQIFQYHFSHLLDKPFESLTGYIHVLPGAFSGYNWNALKSQKFKVMRSDGQAFEKDIQKRTKQQILKKYLKTVIYNEALDNIQQANMYLAEDRILCLEIFTKKKNNFNLEYLPDAYSYVDPITTLPKLMSQRKRWINGSWFALDYVLKHKGRVSQSSHNCWEKFWFHFNMLHAEIMKYVSYLAIAFFFVTIHLMVLEFSQTTLKNYFMKSYSITEQELVYAKIFSDFFSIRSVINSFAKIFDFIYLSCLGILIYRSLTIKKQDDTAKRSFNTISTWFGILGFLSIILIFVNLYQALFTHESQLTNIKELGGLFTQQTFIYLLAAIVGTHIIVILTAFSFGTYCQIVMSMFSYFFFAPSYVNLFFIYAFCRIDDLSWGTKGLDTQSKSKQATIRKKFIDQKIKFTLTWLSTNIIISLLLIGLSNNFDIQNYIIWIFSAYFALIMVIKMIFVIIYLLQYYTVKKIKSTLMVNRNRQKNILQGKRFKNMVNQFIVKMKEVQIDQHVDQINQELVKKRIFDQVYQIQKEKLIEEKQNKIGKVGNKVKIQSPNQENQEDEEGIHKRISFKDLKKISQIGIGVGNSGKSRGRI